MPIETKGSRIMARTTGLEPAISATYDANGDRVRKDSGGAWTEYLYFNGMPMTELDSSGNWTDYIFANGMRLAQAGSLNATNPAATTTYYSSDQVGSTRVMTDGSGNVVSANESYPFGQAPAANGSSHYLFTGKERDQESGNDYFGARYYASAMGRWMSPDPTQLWYADPTNPQSMNLYGYGYNNPHKYIDKNGNEVVLAVAGAAIGFTTGFVGEWIHDDLSGKGFSWRDSLAYGAGGAATGALAGLTFGGSLLVQAAAGVATSTIGNVGGGLISRGIAGEDVWNADSITTDAKVGFFGGVIGEGVGGLWKAANVTKVRAPIPFGYAGQWAKRFGMGLPKQAADEAGLTSATLGALVGNVGAQINSGMQSQYNSNSNNTPNWNWNEFDMLNLVNRQDCAQTYSYESVNGSAPIFDGMSGCQ